VQDEFTNSTVIEKSPAHRAQRGPGAVDEGPGAMLLPSDAARSTVRLLEQTFDTGFSLMDVGSMQVIRESEAGPRIDWLRWTAVCREVAERTKPEIIEDVAPVVVLAIPLTDVNHRSLVAVGLFSTQATHSAEHCRAAAASLGCDHRELHAWLADLIHWDPSALLRVGNLVVAHLVQRRDADQQQEELLETSSHLLTTYEEISLLHRLTEHLSISSGEVELAAMAIGWLSDVIPAEAVAVHLAEARDSARAQGAHTRSDAILTRGQLPLEECRLSDLVNHLTCGKGPRPIVANRLNVTHRDWPFPGVRDVVLVPVIERSKPRGWLLAVNHTGDVRLGSRDFGSVEARLLASVATILGIHGSNIALFRQQTDFFEEVVRALTSAIDAKDPYTCGHSDRVARVSVCLARQLGLSSEELNTLYLSGLLHDIGKIGINDAILRKPGRLTKEEFEHIKTHPELGYKILRGVKRLDKALPVVLHHHENWDGTGYPHGLKGEDIPYLARICAVADGFDAMGSDRPYRAGMPDEKVDDILRDGAGKQWDPNVVDAFFAVREEVRRISRQERHPLSLNVQQWR
jgi:HD-GYP domain-containing protein (c-di-GMP phosphodiesterase class II)